MAHSELGPSTHGMCWWCHLPCHLPCLMPRHMRSQHHFPCNCHVSSHVIDHVNLHVIIAIHIIAKSTATLSAMSSMRDMVIEFVKKIILFMMFIFVIKNGFLGFGGQEHSVTFLKRHGSSNLWQKFKKYHEVWSVTLNTWRYLRSWINRFLVIFDENF